MKITYYAVSERNSVHTTKPAQLDDSKEFFNIAVEVKGCGNAEMLKSDIIKLIEQYKKPQ